MKKILLLLSITVATAAFAQKSPTCNVVGEAKKLVLPDKAVFSINISAIGKTENESYQKLSELSNALLKKLNQEGFSENQIKLTSSSIDENYVYLNNSSKKEGYKASQSFTVKFGLDKSKIVKVYEALTGLKLSGLTIDSYTECSEELKKKTQLELIEKALMDAKEKASLIAKVSGFNTVAIQSVYYKFTTNEPMPFADASVRFSAPKMMTAKSEENSSTNFYSINETEFYEEVKAIYQLNP